MTPKAFKNLCAFLLTLMTSPLLLASPYTAQNLYSDCLEAEKMLTAVETPRENIQTTRCISYLEGVADGYSVADYLATRIGVNIGAFCPPDNPSRQLSLVRSVLTHLEKTPNKQSSEIKNLVPLAFAQSYPCQ